MSSDLIKSKQVKNVLFRVRREEAASNPREWGSTLSTIYAWERYFDSVQISPYSDSQDYPTPQDFMEDLPADALYWPIRIVDSGGFWLTVMQPVSDPEISMGFAVVTREKAHEFQLDFNDMDMLNRVVNEEMEAFERYVCGDVYCLALHGTLDIEAPMGKTEKNVLEIPLASISDVHGPTEEYLDFLATELAGELVAPFAGVTSEDISGQDWIAA